MEKAGRRLEGREVRLCPESFQSAISFQLFRACLPPSFFLLCVCRGSDHDAISVTVSLGTPARELQRLAKEHPHQKRGLHFRRYRLRSPLRTGEVPSAALQARTESSRSLHRPLRISSRGNGCAESESARRRLAAFLVWTAGARCGLCASAACVGFTFAAMQGLFQDRYLQWAAGPE